MTTTVFVSRNPFLGHQCTTLVRLVCCLLVLLAYGKGFSAEVLAQNAKPLLSVGAFTSKGATDGDAAATRTAFLKALKNVGTIQVLESPVMKGVRGKTLGKQPLSSYSIVGQLTKVSFLGEDLYTLNIHGQEVASGKDFFAMDREIQGSLDKVLTDAVPVLAQALAQEIAKRNPTDSVPAIVPQPSAKPLGSLMISTLPQGLPVSLDGRLLSEKTPVQVDRVPLGMHHLQIVAAGFFPDSSSIVVDSGDVVVAELTPRLAAMLELAVEPKDAKVYLGAAQSPQVDSQPWMLMPGKTIVRIERADYFTQIDTLNLSAGVTTQRKVTLKSSLGILNISANQKVHVHVDGNDEGLVPARCSRLQAGTHSVQIVANGFDPIDDDVKVAAGDSIEKNYELHRSHAWQDSVHRFRVLLAPRILAGIVFAGGATYALAQEFQMIDARNRAQDALNSYGNATTNFSVYKTAYQDDVAKIATTKRQRNMGSIAAAIGALGLGVSFAF